MNRQLHLEVYNPKESYLNHRNTAYNLDYYLCGIQIGRFPQGIRKNWSFYSIYSRGTQRSTYKYRIEAELSLCSIDVELRITYL